ncbi:MAG: OmpH family outer membrane protein [Pirellulaceae bacterium]|nr:OmpH family outer membrane protein [Pirellulaceae bacterium]
MRAQILSASAALMIVGSFAMTTVVAQQPNAAATGASGTRIAVIDVGYIVKKHPTIKQQQTAIRDQVKVAQDELVKRREALVKDAEQLKAFREGSPEFNQLQERLANQEAQLKLDMVRKEKELDGVEASMAIEFYKQLQTLISSVAEHNQIDLVLRSNREEPDLKNPATIQMALEKGVIYNKPALDMTDLVLKMIESQAPAATTPQGGAPVMNANAPRPNGVTR